MYSLPIFLRLHGRPVILLGTGEARAAKARLLERAGAEIVGEEAAVALAIVAIEDDAEAEAAVMRLKARGILVNATDRPALCDFTLPAIVDRDPVLIAIGTGGASAGLAKMLRQRLEALLPASLGTLATHLHAARDKIRARWPDATARRKAIDAALDGPLDPFSATLDNAVTSWLQADAQGEQAQLITIIIRSADPDDLTLAEARWLGRADHVYHSAVVPSAILDRARADATRTPISAPPRAFSGLSLYLLGKAQP